MPANVQSRFIFFLLLLLIFSKCTSTESNTTKQQQIWIDVYARFLETDQNYKVEATFSRGDTLPAAKSFQLDGTISINDQLLESRQLSSSLYRYLATFPGTYMQILPFKIKDNSIALKNIALTLPIIPGFEIQVQELEAGTSYFLQLKEKLDLQANESMVLIISDQNGKTESQTIEGPFSGQNIPLAPAKLEALDQSNDLSIYLVMKQQQTAQQKNINILQQTESYSISKSWSPN